MVDMDEMGKIEIHLPLSLLADLRVRAELAGVPVTEWIKGAVVIRRNIEDGTMGWPGREG